MERIYLNNKLSRELCEKGVYIPKYCYDNVYNNISAIGTKFKEEDIKIMFCYVSVGNLKGVFTRHACYYLEGEAIDPTIARIHGDKLNDYEISYIPFKIMSVDEYFILLSREKRTDLFKTFKQVELIKNKELTKHGIVLIG